MGTGNASFSILYKNSTEAGWRDWHRLVVPSGMTSSLDVLDNGFLTKEPSRNRQHSETSWKCYIYVYVLEGIACVRRVHQVRRSVCHYLNIYIYQIWIPGAHKGTFAPKQITSLIGAIVSILITPEEFRPRFLILLGALKLQNLELT